MQNTRDELHLYESPRTSASMEGPVRLVMRTRSTRRPVSSGMSPRTSSHEQVPRSSLRRRQRAQELHNGAKQGQIVVMPDERKAEGLEVGQQHVHVR